MDQICNFRHKVSESPCIHYCEGGFCKMEGMFRCIEAVYRDKAELSHSGIQDYMVCKRKYYLKHLKGIQVRSEMISDAMKLGQFFHAGYSAFYRTLPDWIDGTIQKYWPGEMAGQHQKDILKVWALLEFIQGDGLVLDREGFISCEHKFNLTEPKITGKIDRLYRDHFAEVKLTTRPEHYVSPHFLESQLGTYFMAQPECAYALMEVVRLPGQKQSDEDESPTDYMKRVKADITKRPGHYFQGYDKQTKRFGKRFYRTEFDLDGIKQRYNQILWEIKSDIERDSFYKEPVRCLVPEPCEMLPVCESGGVSELIYEQRKGE